MAPLSRFTVSLRTDETKPNEYYHQICALSENTINKNFERLFAQRGDEIAKLKYFTGDIKAGNLSAVLDPPRVTLQLQNVDNPQLLFRVRFKSGILVVGKGEKNTIKLDGWEVTVSAFMNTMVASPEHQNLTDKQIKGAIKAKAELEKSYDFYSPATIDEQNKARDPNVKETVVARKMKPGEYSIHRLFAAISEGSWSAPLLEESSVPGPNGTRITLEKWIKEPENSVQATKVTSLLGEWAATHTHSAFFTLGLQVELPEKEESHTATFIPTSLRLQNYPYFTNDEIETHKNPADFPVGFENRPYNSFVYCEATDGATLPSIHRLPFTGNLAEPDGPNGLGEINGSFVISHQLFMDRHLLPLLRELSKAIQVIPLRPTCKTSDNGGDIFAPRFAFGCDPSDPDDKRKLPNSQADRGNPADKFFDWKWSPTGGYEWSDYVEADGSDRDYHDFVGYRPGAFFRRWSMNCKMSVKITWVEGQSKMKVAGRTEYFHWEGYNRSTPNFSRQSGALWGRFTTIVTWSFIIELAVPSEVKTNKEILNGVIEPHVKGIDEATGMPTDFKLNTDDMSYVLDKTHLKVGLAVEDRVKAAVKNITANLQNKFTNVGRFYYPGGQELTFGDPLLTRQGDLIATITYKDLPPGRIGVRPANTMKYEAPAPTEPETVEADPILEARDDDFACLLSWGGQVDSYEPPTEKDVPGRAKITLRGSNNTGKTIAFRRLQIHMLPTQFPDNEVKSLFPEDNPDFWEDPKVVEAEWKKRREARKAERARKKAEREREEAARLAKEKADKEAAEEAKRLAKEKAVTEAGKTKEEVTGGTTPITPDPSTPSSPETPPATKEQDASSTKEQGSGSGSVPSTEEWVVLKADTTQMEGQDNAAPPPPTNVRTSADRARPVAPEVKTSHSVVSDLGNVFRTIGSKLGFVDEDDDQDPEPKPPVPKASFSYTSQGITQNGQFRINDEDGEIFFDIVPVNKDGEVEMGGKIILPAHAKIKIVLEGAVSTFGRFILDVGEFWADPTALDSDVYDGKYPHTFICAEIDIMGGGEINVVSYDESKKIQGISEKE
ncbi:hypothetical protein TASIC1_0005068500 [Trichoderma asperellum]|uniref:Uncharacterized protein n=1 Tax=Trichoderma asperellum TaxID=101201 RepID=A0A6V8QTB1_TRIAP|nr:hypothetical protein TASIC1_0005068500 [Trichoderma asperellum]